MNLTKIVGSVIFVVGAALAVTGQVAQGGTYTLEQSVIAGGGDSVGGTYSVTGTPGQPSAGTLSTTGAFGVRGGFWQGALFPTAASVTIRGQVLSAQGRAVSRAIVMFTDGSGVGRSCISNPFGYYTIDGVEVGQTYIVTVEAKNFLFAPRAVMVEDSLSGFDLIMLP